MVLKGLRRGDWVQLTYKLSSRSLGVGDGEREYRTFFFDRAGGCSPVLGVGLQCAATADVQGLAP